MKKGLLCMVCLALMLSGCSNHQSRDQGSSIQESPVQDFGSTKTYTEIKLDFDSEEKPGPLGIKDGWFYYCIGSDNYNDTSDYTYWKYNLGSGEKVELGTIENHQTSSATYAFIADDKIFTTVGTTEGNLHLIIDAGENRITTLSKENSFPPLIFTIKVNEMQFLEFQPSSISDDGYRYQVRIGNADGTMREIISKERHSATGEMMISPSVYDDIIYTFEYRDENRYICTYDLNGNELSRGSNDMVNDFLDTPNEYTGSQETLWSMKVINGYYFFNTMSGKQLVLRKENGDYTKIESLSIDNISFVQDSFSNLVDIDGVTFLYDYNTNKFLSLNTNSGELTELDLKTRHDISYMNTDGKNLLYLTDEYDVYYIENAFV